MNNDNIIVEMLLRIFLDIINKYYNFTDKESLRLLSKLVKKSEKRRVK